MDVKKLAAAMHRPSGRRWRPTGITSWPWTSRTATATWVPMAQGYGADLRLPGFHGGNRPRPRAAEVLILFNEAAPSTLGTITSFGLMGMAKALKGKAEAGAAGVR